MIVVADSGPPHYLILIGQVELLHRFYGEVAIPDTVADELRAAGSPVAVRNWIARLPEWVVVTPVSGEQLASITQDLDPGERAAIALAGSIGADLLLIDDAAGRAEAAKRNLRVTGTLGVLRTAAELELINVPDLLAKLMETTFYVDDDLLNVIFGQWL